jgi:transposase
MLVHIGIDVDKTGLTVCVLVGDQRINAEFKNTDSGYAGLLALARKAAKGADMRFCMESTGGYELGLAFYLQAQGCHVSVENPRRIKSFAIGIGVIQKTDKVDAWAIAQYSLKAQPSRWYLADPDFRELSHVMRRIEQVQAARNAEVNRLENKFLPDLVKKSIDEVAAGLKKQLKELWNAASQIAKRNELMSRFKLALEKKPGIATKTALWLIAEIGDPSLYESAESCAAYGALNPVRHQSGKNAGLTTLTKHGNKRLKACLGMPVITAYRLDPAIKSLRKRLLAKGMKPSGVRAACMRKLLMHCFGIMKRVQKNLEPSYAT